jgi:hypothetical protein
MGIAREEWENIPAVQLLGPPSPFGEEEPLKSVGCHVDGIIDV